MYTWKRMCVLLLLKAVFYISIKSIWSNVSFKISASLLIFWLDDLSVNVSGLLKAPTTFVLQSISLFMSVYVFFMYLGDSMLGA